MTYPTVNNVVTDARGNPVPNATVVISLVGAPAFSTDVQGEIINSAAVYTDATGAWSTTLKPNALITPSGTYYLVQEPGGASWTIVVPNDTATHTLQSLLVVSPNPPAGLPGVVRYDQAQTLSSGQKTQAQTNMGVDPTSLEALLDPRYLNQDDADIDTDVIELLNNSGSATATKLASQFAPFGETARAQGAESTNATAISNETARATAAEATKANDAAVVHLAGAETISGAKAFTAPPTVPTQSPLDNSTKAASTAYADAAVAVEKSRAQTFEASLPATYGPGGTAWQGLPEYLLPAPIGGSSDDTAALNAVLGISGPKIVRARPGASYNAGSAANGSLVVPSNTWFDARGATFTRMAGGPCLLHNSAYLGSGARDTNITITGGTWNHNSAAAAYSGTGAGGYEANTVNLHRIDGVRTELMAFTDNGSACKYSILFCDVTRFRARGFTFTSRPSDGVHVQGPASDGLIQDMSGYTGDDFISLTGCDYTANQLTTNGGNITDVLIENVYLNGGASGVELLAGTGAGTSPLTLARVTVRGVRGTIGNGNVIRILDDTNDAHTTGGIWDDILVQDVSAQCNGGGYGSPRLALSSTGITNGGVMRKVTLRDIYLPAATNQIEISPGKIESLTIDGLSNLTTAPLTVGAVDIASGATITNLTVDRLRLTLDTSAGFAVKQQGTVSDLHASDWKNTGGVASGAMLLYGTTTRVHARAWKCDNGINVNAATEAPTIYASDCNTGSFFVQVNNASASATLFGHRVTASSTSMFRSASQTVRVSGRDCLADVAKMTPQAGDILNNLNGSAPAFPYAGVAVYDGSKWRAERGYIASGIATLAAGTVTVSNTFITGSSKIRLEMFAPGGTVGWSYVSARTAGTGFTITSTSATDTSQIYWELVQI